MLDQSDGWSMSTATEPDDQVDLVAAIAAELSACPINEAALHQCVWSFVGAERNRGTNPGKVIIALTDLVEDALIVPAALRQGIMRTIILWCVEAYFGHLGGDVHAGAGGFDFGEPKTSSVSLLGREGHDQPSR